MILSLVQTVFDPVETGGWVHDMNHPDNKLQKTILVQAGIGDARVAVVSAELLSRSLNASLVYPATVLVSGMNELRAPFKGSAFVEWDYEDTIQPHSILEPIPAITDTHECVRREPEAQQQIDVFLRTGVVEQFCDGICKKDTCIRNPDVMIDLLRLVLPFNI